MNNPMGSTALPLLLLLPLLLAHCLFAHLIYTSQSPGGLSGNLYG